MENLSHKLSVITWLVNYALEVEYQEKGTSHFLRLYHRMMIRRKFYVTFASVEIRKSFGILKWSKNVSNMLWREIYQTLLPKLQYILNCLSRNKNITVQSSTKRVVIRESQWGFEFPRLHFMYCEPFHDNVKNQRKYQSIFFIF